MARPGVALAVAPCANKIFAGAGEATSPRNHKTSGFNEMVVRWDHPWGAGSEQRSIARPVPPQDLQLVSKIIKLNNLNIYSDPTGLELILTK